jgi:hypothetical protein
MSKATAKQSTSPKSATPAQDLLTAIGAVRARLEEMAGNAGDKGKAKRDEAQPPRTKAAWRAALHGPPQLESLCQDFGLSLFERGVLVLCAGMELDARFAEACAAAHGDAALTFPTLGLALAALPEAGWDKLAPEAPLRHWRFIDLHSGAADTLLTMRLRLDERVVHHLLGTQYIDDRLIGYVDALPPHPQLSTSQRDLAAEIGATWQTPYAAELPVLQLCGTGAATRAALAAEICRLADVRLHRMLLSALPDNPTERAAIMRLWTRDARLSNSALLLDCSGWDATEPGKADRLAHMVDGLGGRLIVSSETRQAGPNRAMLTFEVSRPTSSEERALWQEALAALGSKERTQEMPAAEMSGEMVEAMVDALVAQFSLDASSIQTASRAALAGQKADARHPAARNQSAPTALFARLWDQCRVQTRPNLGALAQRIETHVEWDELILPPAQKALLEEIKVHVRHRGFVYEDWGFAEKSSRGLGLSALFTGPSGTGKTMAAEVLATELRLDLYRIDLSAVVSKYIGETEKNLARVFDAAEGSGAILLFDEADALFGKRSEVKESHDRYANIEISYLLQRMEAYRGLAILTTNMKDALDPAFLRRIRFIVRFPFPDMQQRTEIWRRVFPQATKKDGLDYAKLAQLSIAGGNIRNIALAAAFLAVAARGPVRMQHLLAAARNEYAKLERSLSEAETRGWLVKAPRDAARELDAANGKGVTREEAAA